MWGADRVLDGWLSPESDGNGPNLSENGDVRMGLDGWLASGIGQKMDRFCLFLGMGGWDWVWVWVGFPRNQTGMGHICLISGKGEVRRVVQMMRVCVAEMIRRRGSGCYGLLSRLYVADSSGCTMPGGLYMAPEPGYAKYQRCDSAPHTCDITSCVPCISHLAKRGPRNLPCIRRLAVAWGGLASREHGCRGGTSSFVGFWECMAVPHPVFGQIFPVFV